MNFQSYGANNVLIDLIAGCVIKDKKMPVCIRESY